MPAKLSGVRSTEELQTFRMKTSLISLIIGLITTIFGIILAFWFNNVYDKPLIEWYSRPYYKIDDIAVGNIYLINSGRKSDHNISLILEANIKDTDIKIVDITSNYSIKHNDNKTIVIIDEMKPGESADVTFKDKGTVDDINFQLISESSNTKNIFEDKWWHLSGFATSFILVILIFLSGLTTLILKKYLSEER